MAAQEYEGLQSIAEVSSRISQREVSPVELVERALQRIDALDPVLNAHISVLGDEAIAEAKKADSEIGEGKYRGALHGIPLSVKDLYWTRGTRTTCGSRILSDFVPSDNATVVQRLREAGAIIVAKANMLEFAYASVHPDYGATKNPWDLSKTTSGSSGGSAASVAVGMDFGSFGTDTAGSIRVPASFCGVSGLKPTFGRVSRYGLQLLSWSLDHAGPFARSAQDIAYLLQAVAGQDPRDPFSAEVGVPDYPEKLSQGADDISLAVVTNFMDEGVDSQVRTAVEQSLEVFVEAGFSVREISIPELEEPAINAVLQILLPEARHCHREWVHTRTEDYTPTVLERLRAGLDVPAVDYFEAQDVRDKLRARLQEIQKDIDLLVMPTTPMVATPLEDTTVEVGQGEEDLTALVRMTAPFDLTGQPVLSVPCGFNHAGLPIGLQIVGRDFEEALVLQAAHAYQSRTDWHRRLPAVLT